MINPDHSRPVLCEQTGHVYANAQAAAVACDCPKMVSALISAINSGRRFLGLHFFFVETTVEISEVPADGDKT